MRKIIYFVLFLAVLSACNGERKPLEVIPMTVEGWRLNSNDSLEKKYYPIPNSFYFRNFRDDKQCLKEFWQYVRDTIGMNMVFEQRASMCFSFYKKNAGVYMEDGETHVDQECYYICFADSLNRYIEWISTTSKYEIWRLDIDEFPQRCDYKYHIVRKDKAAVVYFDYKEFNTDVWQKFLNVVFYDREKLWWSDYNQYHLGKGDGNAVLAWRNWSAPTRYSLLNQRTKEIECVIKYPLADNYDAFTMEIH